MKKRVHKYIIVNFTIIAIGLIYAKVFQSLGFGMPCVFSEITGFYCPGCGVSRMCIRIVNLDFYRAFRNNPFVFIILPYLAYIYVSESIRYIKGIRKKRSTAYTVVGIVVLVVALVFGVLRNIDAFSYLRPIGL